MDRSDWRPSLLEGNVLRGNAFQPTKSAMHGSLLVDDAGSIPAHAQVAMDWSGTGVHVQGRLSTLQQRGHSWPATTSFTAASGDGPLRRGLRSLPRRLGSLGGAWCQLTHSRIMWPVRGHYTCSHCGRQFK